LPTGSIADSKKIDSVFNKYDNKTGPGVAIGVVMDGKVVFTK
jgi:hypothetical protein